MVNPRPVIGTDGHRGHGSGRQCQNPVCTEQAGPAVVRCPRGHCETGNRRWQPRSEPVEPNAIDKLRCHCPRPVAEFADPPDPPPVAVATGHAGRRFDARSWPRLPECSRVAARMPCPAPGSASGVIRTRRGRRFEAVSPGSVPAFRGGRLRRLVRHHYSALQGVQPVKQRRARSIVVTKKAPGRSVAVHGHPALA